jgi:hypothetical protein
LALPTMKGLADILQVDAINRDIAVLSIGLQGIF